MSPETLNFLKWFIGIPSALVAVVTLPFIIRKYHLECKKLQLEIIELKQSLESPEPTEVQELHPLFVWFAKYWTIPCYGSLGLFFILFFIIKHMLLLLIGFVLSLLFFVSGSACNETYETFVATKKLTEEDPDKPYKS